MYGSGVQTRPKSAWCAVCCAVRREAALPSPFLYYHVVPPLAVVPPGTCGQQYACICVYHCPSPSPLHAPTQLQVVGGCTLPMLFFVGSIVYPVPMSPSLLLLPGAAHGAGVCILRVCFRCPSAQASLCCLYPASCLPYARSSCGLSMLLTPGGAGRERQYVMCRQLKGRRMPPLRHRQAVSGALAAAGDDEREKGDPLAEGGHGLLQMCYIDATSLCHTCACARAGDPSDFQRVLGTGQALVRVRCTPSNMFDQLVPGQFDWQSS